MQRNPIDEAMKIVLRNRHCRICLTPEQADEFAGKVGENEFPCYDLGNCRGTEEYRYLIEGPMFDSTLTYTAALGWVVAPYRARPSDSGARR